MIGPAEDERDVGAEAEERVVALRLLHLRQAHRHVETKILSDPACIDKDNTNDNDDNNNDSNYYVI